MLVGNLCPLVCGKPRSGSRGLSVTVNHLCYLLAIVPFMLGVLSLSCRRLLLVMLGKILLVKVLLRLLGDVGFRLDDVLFSPEL